MHSMMGDGLLRLVLAHLLGDFVLQPRRLGDAKSRLQPAALAVHGTIHYLLALAMLAPVVPLDTARVHALLLAMTASHLAIDVGKARVVAARLLNEGWAFTLDQLLHGVVLTVVAALLAPAVPDAGLSPGLLLLAVYVGVIFGGGYWVKAVLGPWADRAAVGQDRPEQLRDAGLTIGWLERFLFLTALLTGSHAAAGFVVAAKSVVRFPELENRVFAEYFLIGTLLSLSLAVAGALLVHLLTRGSFPLV